MAMRSGKRRQLNPFVKPEVMANSVERSFGAQRVD